MPSLPTVGSDVDVWGGELNTFLQVGHNPDGTLNSSALSPPVTPVPTSAAVNCTQFGVTPSSPTGTDVTAAMKTLLANQVAAAQANGTNYVEIFMPPGVYLFSGAPTQGGATKGNAMIPIPIVAPTAPKVTIFIHGGTGGDSLPHWQQTTGQKSGTVLYCTHTGTNDASFGECSVLGGPTPKQGYGNSGDSSFLFNNVHVIIDGISVCTPTMNPTMCGFDFRGCAQMTIGTAGAFVDVGTPTMIAGPVPSNTWVFGLSGPNDGNNDLVNIRSWSCEGYYIGMIITEHTVVTRVCVVYCAVGLTVLTQNYAHGNIIQYASVEACPVAISWQSYQHVIVQVLDIEDAAGTPYAPTAHIYDAGNNARGYVGFEITGGGNGEGTEPIVNGGTNLNVQNIGRKAATFTTGSDGLVAIPASGATLKNPYYKNALIYMTGGTVTAIQVNTGGVGLRQVGTTTPAVFCLPSGASLQLTYSVVPTNWVWTLLS